MTPQSHFAVIAPVATERIASLRAVLNTMNLAPGMADPHNALLPFGAFERLHFARLALLDDPTLKDLEAYGLPQPALPIYLAFIGDCDGAASSLLEEICQRAEAGLRSVFQHCLGFETGTALLAWMLQHNLPTSASYVNHVGRTVQQINQEAALQRALAKEVSRTPIVSGADARHRRQALIAFVAAEQQAGRLQLTPSAPTPLGWQITKTLNLVGIPLAGLIALPVLLVLSPLLVFQLRKRETSDPVICPRPSLASLQALKELEDRDFTNQYTALGLVKPGRFRRWLLTFLLVLIDYACQHVFTRGFLARVQTIHFAHWIFLDDRTRVAFVSNYDGSHEAYMDDFINKVAWGLNLVFSNGVGWPETDWLIKRGARIEQRFKSYQRRHQLPTQVWYKAYPGLALTDLKRNQRIREGLERAEMTDAQALDWLKLL